MYGHATNARNRPVSNVKQKTAIALHVAEKLAANVRRIILDIVMNAVKNYAFIVVPLHCTAMVLLATTVGCAHMPPISTAIIEHQTCCLGVFV